MQVTKESGLGKTYNIEGFPTIKVFVSGNTGLHHMFMAYTVIVMAYIVLVYIVLD